jgi:hypothetical protein
LPTIVEAPLLRVSCKERCQNSVRIFNNNADYRVRALIGHVHRSVTPPTRHDEWREIIFLEFSLQKASKLPASGRNSLYRPPRVSQRRFGTCRASVAALAGTDNKICEQAT